MARISGDEFAIIQADLNEPGCRLGQGCYFCRACDASLSAELWNRALDSPVRGAAGSR